MRSGISPGMWIERICRLPLAIVLERTQKPSAIRQQSVARSPSRTTGASAGYCRTEIGSASISLMSSFPIAEEMRRRLMSAARIAPLDTEARSNPEVGRTAL